MTLTRAALFSLLALAACGKPATPAPPPSPSAEAAPLIMPMTEGDAFAFRVALMRAHLAAALALADEGEPSAAAAQFRAVLHDIYEPDRAAFEARAPALDTAKIELAALRAEIGAPVSDLRALRDELDRQIARFAPRSYSRAVVVEALLTHLASQYARGVEGQTVIAPARYHDAYGLSRVTLDLVTQTVREGVPKTDLERSQLQRAVESLANMFPSATAPTRPAAPGEVQSQITRVKLAFPGMQR